MKWVLAAALALSVGCAGTSQPRVVTPYAGDRLPARVRVEAVNATGRELPVPPAGVIEQAMRVLAQRSDPRSTIPDLFRHAVSERVRDWGTEPVPPGDAQAPRLLVTLRAWDVRNGEATGAVVVVSAGYQLLDASGHVLWEAQLERWPVRLTGPNLSAYEAAQVARACAERGLESLSPRKNLP